MSGGGPSHLRASSGSSRRSGTAQGSNSVGTSVKSLSEPPEDIAAVRSIYYPCFGNIDLKTYTDARIYGLSFRRLHDEWVVLGRPHIDAGHWPRMVGHQGLPSSMEDLISVSDYYDRKLFAQVLLDTQGKPANRDRPLDDFIISMVTAAAVINADLMVYRFVQDQPASDQAIAQATWHKHFSTFMHDSIRHFCNERKVCDRLGTHHCVIPLMFGQASTVTLPTHCCRPSTTRSNSFRICSLISASTSAGVQRQPQSKIGSPHLAFQAPTEQQQTAVPSDLLV